MKQVAAFLGGEPDTWTTREVGDGNINFVYIVQGQSDAIVVKQALPYVRCVGESWPLTPDRARLEAEALMEGASHCPTNVPKVCVCVFVRERTERARRMEEE
jgi:5-methylthioribose kinase